MGGGQVLERWKKKEPGRVRILLARTGSKMFVSVHSLICARSYLSAYSVRVALPNFKFAVPIGAGGGSCGREGSASSVPGFAVGSEKALWPPLVTKHRKNWNASLLPSGVQKIITFPIRVRGESIYYGMDSCRPT